MTSNDLDLAHLRTWIGRTEEAEDVLSPALVRKFVATFNLAWEPEQGAPAPRMIHWCLAQTAAPTRALGADGHPARGDFLPPVPLPRRMRAGGRIDFNGDLKIGSIVRRVARIADVSAKQGRSGSLCFVSVEERFFADGKPVLDERQDIVYRGHDRETSKAPGPAAGGSHQRSVEATALLLFRYSALTFNGHRIHYDRAYATEVERYPGLVIQGPLQATLLFNEAVALRGTPPDSFEFRSASTLFDTDRIMLHAETAPDRLVLWTTRENGPRAMTAEAGWAAT